MYAEQEKDRVYNQSHGLNEKTEKKPQWGAKTSPAASGSKNPTSGATSSSAPKSTTQSRELTTGKWHSVSTTSYGKHREPMDVDRAEHMTKGLCFTCHQQGHLSRDCPNKKQQVRAVVATPTVEPAKDTKDAVTEKE